MKIDIKLPDRNLSLYQDGRLNELLAGFSNAVKNHNTSAVICFDGRSGMGKSTLMNQVAITLDSTYSLKKLHFSPKTFLEGDDFGKVGLANAKKGDFICFDEAMLISNRNTMTAINKMIIQAMSMIRSKQIYVGFCVNSIFDLDKNLVLHRADLLIHLYGQTLTDRGRFCAFFKGKDNIDRIKQLYLFGKKYYDYRKPKANFIGRFSKEFVLPEDEYEAEKQQGVNTFLRGFQTKNFDRDKLIYDLRAEGMRINKIASLLGISEQRVYVILGINMKNLEKT